MATGLNSFRKHLWVDVDTASEITGVDVSTILEWHKFFHPYLAPEVVRNEPRFTKDDLSVLFHIKSLIHNGGLKRESAKRALAWCVKRVA